MLKAAHKTVEDLVAGPQAKSLADGESQAQLFKEVSELHARKHKLEQAIKMQESVNNSLHEAAAVREIEAYKARLVLRG